MLIHPVKKVYITQAWGVNPQNYARFGLKGHNGLDYRAFLPNGDRCFEEGKSEVFAPHDGKVIENAFDADGYGNYLKIENDSEGSILAHLSPPSSIPVGESVKQGDLVGFQGYTGNSTGIHLHWGYYPKPRNKNNGYSGTIDPTPLITDIIKPPVEITDKTKIPQITDDNGNPMEVQAIRSRLNDLNRDLISAQTNLNIINAKVKALADQNETFIKELEAQKTTIITLTKARNDAQEKAAELQEEINQGLKLGPFGKLGRSIDEALKLA